MEAKVIPLSKRQKHRLSRLMIAALVEASIKQKQGIPFGPADIKGGSVISLINRGLIIHKEVEIENQIQQMWQVTPEAFAILSELGIDAVA